MAAPYPVVFDVTLPTRFERAQLVLRLVLLVLLGLLGLPLGLVFVVLYLALPAIAAIFVSTHGAEHYRTQVAPVLVRVLRWVFAVYAYLAFLIDRLPTREADLEPVRYEVTLQATPTTGAALSRLVRSLPEALVLLLLLVLSGLVWLLAAVCVLVTEAYPRPLYEFQRGLIRWQARLAAYHASLVDQLPPFALETGPAAAPPQVPREAS